jgi:uncharacterized protein (TIGR00661 family)
MRFVFIVQGEGRGHLTQAISTYELLEREGHEVVEVLVGTRSPSALPPSFLEKIGCRVTTFESVYFLYSARRQRSLLFKTILHHASRLHVHARSIALIKRRLDACDADRVINFYEVLAGVTYALLRPRTPCTCIAHQYLFLHPGFVFPARVSRVESRALLLFTRLTRAGASQVLALSFREMPPAGRLHVIPPRIRREVTRQATGEGDYILGYMVDAAFAGQVVAWHERHEEVPLHFFWSKGEVKAGANLVFHPLDATAFPRYMARCKGYASTGGFESICEAMYLQKPVMMVPAHVEQECNAFDAARAGAGIVSPAFDLDALLEYIPRHEKNDRFVAWADRADELLMRCLGL